jgi:phosphate transport system protein
MSVVSVGGSTGPALGVDLAEIDRQVIQLFAMVTDGLAAVTAAFLGADREVAGELIAKDPLIDRLQSSTEALVERALTHPSVGPRDLRLLVAVLRIVPELERSGDLVEHIALRTPQGLARQLTPQARGLIGHMGDIGVQLWRAAATAYADRDAQAAGRLRELDDELDDLHVRLSAELAESATSIPVAIEMSLVARFFERLGDHAVNVTRRIGDLVPDAHGLA